MIYNYVWFEEVFFSKCCSKIHLKIILTYYIVIYFWENSTDGKRTISGLSSFSLYHEAYQFTDSLLTSIFFDGPVFGRCFYFLRIVPITSCG
jgi:hypothetical protein